MDDKHELTRVVIEPGHSNDGPFDNSGGLRRIEAWVTPEADLPAMIRAWYGMLVVQGFSHKGVADCIREVAEEMEPEEAPDYIVAEEPNTVRCAGRTFQEWIDLEAEEKPDDITIQEHFGAMTEVLPDPPFTEDYRQSIELAHRHIRTAADCLYGEIGWAHMTMELKGIAAALDEEIGRMRKERGLAGVESDDPPEGRSGDPLKGDAAVRTF